MPLASLDLLLWVAGLAAHLTLVLVLVRRRHFRMFPLFTTLVTLNIGKTLALFVVHRWATATDYFYTYWLLAAADMLVQVGVVCEIAIRTFRPLRMWPSDVGRPLARMIGLSLSIAIAITWLATPHTRLSIQTLVIKGAFFSSVSMSELLVGMIALSVRTGLPARTYATRIAEGLGVYSMVDILVETSHILFGVGRDTHTYTVLSHVRMLAYLVCAAFWILTLWRRPPEARTLSATRQRQLNRLQSLVDFELETVRERQPS